jgi:hypothetical protein
MNNIARSIPTFTPALIAAAVAAVALLAMPMAAAPFATTLSAQTGVPPVARDTSRASAPANDTVPIGFGALKQDEITLSIRTGALLVKVTPLKESLIRLLAPDTYRRLHALAESRKAEVSKGMGPHELFLVSFFSYQPDVTYQPEDIQLGHQGRTLRSRTIVGLTPGWGRQRMQQQENESAIYVFDGPIDSDQDITLQYGMEQTDAWRNIVARMHTERANVKTRSGH